MERTTSHLQASGKVFVLCGLWLVALGMYLLFLRPALLPEDPRYIGSLLETIRSAVPGLERWLGHVFNVMGGFMVATGAITMLVACRLLARRERGTLTAMSVAGAASVALMSDELPVVLGLPLAAVAAWRSCGSPACGATCGRAPLHQRSRPRALLLDRGQARRRRPL